MENENIFWLGEPGQSAGFEAHHDKVIVLQDEFLSGYECPKCLDKSKKRVQGREVSTIRCEGCAGSGRRLKAGNASITVRCSDCDGEGWMTCPVCNGLGGTLVMADNAKRNPTTGVIVSIGDIVTKFKRGEKVIYPSYSGTAYDVTAVRDDGLMVPTVLVVLREDDITSRLHGSLEQNQVKRAEARYTNA